MTFSNDGVVTIKPMVGRKVLFCSIEEDKLDKDSIIGILKDVLPTHFKNVEDYNRLNGYYIGYQDILNKRKEIRPDINHIVLENNAYHIVEFSKGFVFGSPIQYVQTGDSEQIEVDTLNKYMRETFRHTKDMQLGEDWYIGGNAYLMVFPNDDPYKPFEVYNSSPKETFVVYDTGIGKKKMLGGVIVGKKDYATGKEYLAITVYTRSDVYSFRMPSEFDTDKEIEITFIEEEPNWVGRIPIIEYPLNKNRLGKIEIIKTVLDALNMISSSDIDDIDQFVQALLVFINAKINKEEISEMMEMGAINIVSNSSGRGLEADVKLLSQKLLHSETKILYDRLYNNMLTIVGVPKMTDKASSGDTGQARLVGEGWTMADEKAKQDEASFKLADNELLEIVLDICKNKQTEIKTLRASEIDIKFTRNKSDNLLVKTQGLMNLMSAQVAPEVAFEKVGLFSDSSDAVKQSKAFFGESFWKGESQEEQTLVNNANNEIVE